MIGCFAASCEVIHLEPPLAAVSLGASRHSDSALEKLACLLLGDDDDDDDESSYHGDHHDCHFMVLQPHHG